MNLERNKALVTSAVVQFTKALAQEHKRSTIRFNSPAARAHLR